MKPAPVQNPSSLATLRSSFSSLFNKCVAVYPDTEQSEVEGSHSYALSILFSSILALIVHTSVNAQDSTVHTDNNSSNKKGRIALVAGLNAVGYGTSLVIFNNTWYKNYPHTSFHTFNDNGEWLQVDKIGHAWAAYNTGRASTAMWKWAGLSNDKATLIGGLSGAVYLTVIEFLDGHSSKWGWSWGDMGANLFGSGLFIGQQLGWEEQRIQFKFSFHRKDYGDPLLNARADDLFGKSWSERMLKDYNGQTYWFSANLKSFFPSSDLPAWLNIAFGYGAEGMFGGFQNKWTDGDPGFPVDRTDIKRYRQWFLAPDINFSKIKTNKKGLRTLFSFLDAFKFPTPSLELSNNKIKLNAIHF